MIDFGRQLTQADRHAVETAGGVAVLYRPQDTYMAWFDAQSLAAARSIGVSASFVDAGDKIHGGLHAARGQVRVVATVAASVASSAFGALSRVASVRAVIPDPAGELVDILVELPATHLKVLAAVPQVLFLGPAPTGLVLEDEMSDQILAAQITAGTVRPGYETFLESAGVDGEGVVVSIVDSGVDSAHPDLADRVAVHVNYRASPYPRDYVGHGTHVAGIIAGTGVGTGVLGRPTDSSGFLYGLGVSPAAQLVDQNAVPLSSLEDWPPSYGLERLTRDALHHGAAIWNASWHTGEGTGVGYVSTARVIDALVQDGDWTKPGAQPFTMVFSAGNAGTGPQTITAPKEAKNIIVVANSHTPRSGEPMDTIADGSSRGPAIDGRIVPTLAAPGSAIVSTRSLAPGSAGCNLPPTDTPTGPVDAQGLYAPCTGTSMAAPHVTGAVALLTQWWRQRTAGRDPSPALAKALLVNSATDMAEPDRPNPHEGWGRVSLADLLADVPRLIVDQDVVFDDPGDTATYLIRVADPSQPLHVTLAWTDPPAAPGANPALVNDLDLTVTAPDGTVYHGNNFDKGWSRPGGAPDRINNLENVFIPTPVGGAYKVAVAAFNLPGDGIPYSGDRTDQHFALVITNADSVT